MRAAVVVAGGMGVRSGLPGGKQLALIAGEPLVARSLRAFDEAESVDAVVLVADPDRVDEFRREAVDRPGIVKVRAVVAGGATRRSSVAAGLAALPDGVDMVAVHDGARPLIDPETIDSAFSRLASDPCLDGVVVGHPSYDTIKAVGPSGRVSGTPDRGGLWVAQTPQVFRTQVLLDAHARAEAEGWEATDDSMLVEMNGGTVEMVEGSRWNMKVTVAKDIGIVEHLLSTRGHGGTA